MAARHENRNPDRPGDAVVRPVLDVGEKDDLALNRREPAERGEKSRAEIGALQFANGDVGTIDGHAVVERHESSPPNRAQSIERSAMDNR